MSDDSSDEDVTCPICYEIREDLRMLPCWHVACLTCILGMTQSGSGRAVNCHMCREPCLFENIRSIPRPVRCASCTSFVKNPRKLPCCSKVYCLECLEVICWSGVYRCKGKCSFTLYKPPDIQKPRICIGCFCMHTNAPSLCGHAFCEKCQGQQVAGRTCPMCAALRTPIPAPINPIQPRTELDVPLGQQPNQQINQMELISAFQTIRAWQQNNAAQQQDRFQRLLFGDNHSPEDVVKDLKSAGMFLVTMLVTGIVFGLDYKTWIIGMIVMASLKMAKFFNWFLCLLIAWVLWALSLYYFFWEHLALGLIGFLGKFIINLVTSTYFPHVLNKKLPIQCFEIGMAIVTIIFCSSIFTHRFGLSLVRDFLWYNMVPQGS